MSTIGERIKILIDTENLNISTFESMIGAGNNTIGTSIKRNSNFSSSILSKILKKYKNINAEWLLTGEGEMYKNDTGNLKARNLKPTAPVKTDIVLEDTVITQNMTIRVLVAERRDLQKRIKQLEQALKEKA